MRHMDSFTELRFHEWQSLWDIILRARTYLEAHFGSIEGYNLGINDGKVAGRTVDHAHFHLFPRRQGDMADPRGGVRNMFPNASKPWLVREQVYRIESTP